VLQNNVATIISPVVNGYTSLDTSSGSCGSTSFNMLGESSLTTQDNSADYPLGLAKFILECSST
jgi:hypothetical protein